VDGFELSWLNLRGKPQVALVHFTIPCETPHIIESKSFKLYLNSFNNSRFASADEVLARLRRCQRSRLARRRHSATVGVRLVLPEAFATQQVHELTACCWTAWMWNAPTTSPAPSCCAPIPRSPVSETLVSHLLKSNCLVTGQPDWGSVQIAYSGPPSTRKAAAVHRELSQPQRIPRAVRGAHLHGHLAPLPAGQAGVYARYTRRGGLDINPFRTSHPSAMPVALRTARQ
jgi:7-cyano-7-deazaguanine reductase